MKNVRKRIISVWGLLIILGLAFLIIFTDTKKVSAEEQQKMLYLLKVNRVYNTITVYEKDEKGNYTVPIKAMICSVGAKGTQTKLGTFQTKAKYRWKQLMGDVYGQYSTRIVGGILFHSVYYYQNGNPATLATKEYNKLGTAASHGCIRLTVEDAKWIYDNCAVGTTVVVYDDAKSPGPLGKPEAIKIPSNVRWDPTDPSTSNPYKDKAPQITGAKNVKIEWGEEVDLLKGVQAKSSVGMDITRRLSVNGEVDIYSPGKYKVTYSVEDELGRYSTKEITVTVGESSLTPVFKGIDDKVVGDDLIIDEDFALSGVEAYCGDTKLTKENIKVNIKKKNEEEYYITYQINLGKGATATEHATVLIDKDEPVFSGISDRVLEDGAIPDEEYALDGVTISDNYTDSEEIEIIVTIEKNMDGGYLITYEAADEVGNVANEQAVIRYPKIQSVTGN
jgi:hypothetical protein